MSDNYEFEKSQLPQSLDATTPYIDKQWNWLPDTNNGVYTNSGLTQVNFDLSSIFNSNKFVNMNQAYFVVPLTIVGLFQNSFNGTNPLAPTANDWARLGLKQGYFNLVHQAEFSLDGKVLEQTQPFLNQYVYCKLASQMSQDDMVTMGGSLGMGSAGLDSSFSMRYNNQASATTAGLTPGYGATGSTAVGPQYGNGVVNSLGFGLPTQQNAGLECAGLQNQALYSRLLKPIDTTQATQGNMYTPGAGSSFQTATQMANEFRATYQVLATNYMVCYDYAIIRAKDIFDSFANIPLTKRMNGYIRLFLNTGAIGAQCASAAQTWIFSGSTSTFTGTCPLMINTSFNTPTNAQSLVAGSFVSRPPTTSIFGVNLSSSGASHPLPSCRMYYPQVTIKESRAQEYITLNRAKTIKWTNIYFNSYNSITSGSSFSQLVLSGVSKIRGVWIIPSISSTINGLLNTTTVITGITPFSQLSSPFDSLNNGPISLTNLQVSLGGQNLLQNPYFYTFQNFLEQMSVYEKINPGDMGLSCGLVSQQEWEWGKRWYYVDCSRGQLADELTPRALTISFTNNSNLTIDVDIFTEYFVEATLDVLTSECRLAV